MTHCPTERIPVAIIGLGMAAAPHLAALDELQHEVHIVWAASPGAARTEAFAARHPTYPTTNDISSVIADPRVVAVILLTPANTHAELGIEILRNGKHLLVEKPLEARLEKAEALVAMARAVDRRLGVVLQHRFRPAAQRLLDIIREGTLGAIEAAAMSVPWWRPQSYYDEPGRGSMARDGGGVLMTQAIHTLDLLRALVGPLTVRSAVTRRTSLHRMETEDLALALFDLEGGGVASMLATTAAYPGGVETIDIMGTRGAARLRGEHLTVHWLDGSLEVLDNPSSPQQKGPMDFLHHAHRDLLKDFLTAIRTGREPLASGLEALATQRLISVLVEGV